MLTNRVVRTLLIMIILCSSISCDQISKNIVRSSFLKDEKIRLLDNHVMLARVENGGAFLSFGDSLPPEIKFFVLILIPVFALAMGMAFLFFESNISRSTLAGMGFIIGGGIGNIFDRVMYGTVTDFLHIDFYLFRTGIFNMADVLIMTGAMVVAVSAILKETRASITMSSDNF